MSIIGSAKFETSVFEAQATGKIIQNKADNIGNLFVRTRPQFRESNNMVAGALSSTGKIDTVPAAATINVVVPCDDTPVERVLWQVYCDKAWTYTLGVSNSNPLGGTLTLTDATAVDDGDTFVLNGLTFTAETTEGDAVASARKYYAPDQPTAATNLAALLTHATYGVPGITASAAAVSTTDVITIYATTATALQFAQGTSASNEIAWASTSQTNIARQGGATSMAANSTWAGDQIQQWIDGFAYGCIQLTNTDGSSAATFVVRAVRL